MPPYIQPPLVTDPGALSQEAFDYLSANFPGWVPMDGHLEVWLTMAMARIAAEAMDVGSAIPTAIFRYFGSSLLGVLPINALTAGVDVQFTVIDNSGYTVKAGTQIAFQPTGDTLIPFITDADLVINPGSLTGTVHATAAITGAANNGLTGAMVLLDPIYFISTVVAATTSTGGVDAETDAEYLDRLVAELRLLTPRPILAADFAVLSRQVAGVKRAMAVDNLDPVAGTTTNERMVGVAAVDATGSGISSGLKTQVAAYLDSLREVNFVVNMFDPTYTVVNVAFTFTINPGAVAANVQAAAELAVADWLSPARWGVDPGDTELETWTSKSVVTYNDLISVLYAVDGLRSVPTLTINGVAGDLALTGFAPLTQPGTVAGALA